MPTPENWNKYSSAFPFPSGGRGRGGGGGVRETRGGGEKRGAGGGGDRNAGGGGGVDLQEDKIRKASENSACEFSGTNVEWRGGGGRQREKKWGWFQEMKKIKRTLH